MKIHISGKIKLDEEGLMWKTLITYKISKNVRRGWDHEFQVEGWGHLGKAMKSPEHGTENLFSQR